MPSTKMLIWLIEKAVECALGTVLIDAYLVIDNIQFASIPPVEQAIGAYFNLYRVLFMAFYVMLGYGFTSAILNALIYRRKQPISMAWRIGLNLLVFTLSFGAGFGLLSLITMGDAVEGAPSRDARTVYQIGLILYPLSLLVVALTAYAGQKARDRFAPKP